MLEGVGIAIEPLNKAMLNAACDFPQTASTVFLLPNDSATLNKTDPENDEPTFNLCALTTLSNKTTHLNIVVKHDND